MKTITYQIKYFGMIRKTLIVAMLSLAVLVGEGTVSFIMSGYGDEINVYNLTTMVDGDGGFTVHGVNLEDDLYEVQISWDGSWDHIEGTGDNNNNADTYGILYGDGEFKPTDNGTCQLSWSHDDMVETDGFPGTVENKTMSIRIYNTSTNAYVPSTAGYEFNFDLVPPTLLSVVIESEGNANTEWATTENVIKITLTAENEDLGQGALWTESIQGLSATSTVDNSNAKIWYVEATVGGSHEEGAARFSITYFDVNRNPAQSAVTQNTAGVIGTVTIDRTAPIISATILSDDNENNSNALAKVGDDVTLTVTATNEDEGAEVIQVPTITISGAAPTSMLPNVPATSYTAMRTMTGIGDPEGAVAFNISNIKDRAGNTAVTVETHTGGSPVRFDSVPPTLSVVSISSPDNDSDNYAKVGDVVKINITANGNEALQTPVVTIDGEAATVTNVDNNWTWIATKVMDAEDNEQDVVFSISFKDLAANPGTGVTDVLDGTSVRFDATDPAINSTSLRTTNGHDTELATEDDVIIITIESADNLSSIKDAAIAGQSVINQTTDAINKTSWTVNHTLTGDEDDGYASYTYTAVDLAGNTTTVTSATSDIRIDNTAPTLGTIEISSNNDDDARAKIGNTVRVDIVANEPLRVNPTITIGGRAGTVQNPTSDKKTYFATHDMDNTDTEGAVAFTIAFENALGVAGTTIIDDGTGSTTTNSSAVTYDRQAPTLSEVSISTDNTNTSYAKVGSIITLVFVADGSENLIENPTVTILGNAAAVSGSDDSWSATYTTVIGDNAGTVPFTIDFFDLASNPGAQVDETIGGSWVKFDKTAPDLDEGVTIRSDNTNDPAGTLAKSLDVITLSVSADAFIQKPTITIAGNSVGVTISPANDGASFYTATYTMQPDDATAAEIAFTVDFLDLAGNEGDQVTDLIGDADGGVSFDKQKPSFTIISIGSLDNDVGPSADDDHTRAKSGNEITVSLTSDEILKTGSNPTVTIADNNSIVVRTGTVGVTNTFTAKYTMSDVTDGGFHGDPITISISNYFDPAGNEGDEKLATTDGSEVVFDMNDPVLGTVTIESNNTFSNWAAKDDIITVTIISDENLQTSPGLTILSANPAFVMGINEKNWTVEKVVEGGHTQGEVGFNITFEDVAGNQADDINILIPDHWKNVTIDRVAPTITKADIRSDNDNGVHLAVPLNTIKLIVETNENIQQPTITIATHELDPAVVVKDPLGNPAGDDAKIWIATYEMTESDIDDVELDFSITFSDSAGNPGVTHTAITNDDDGLNVTFSKIEPTLSSVSFVSDNSGYNAYANTESVLTLSFQSTEQLIQSTILIEINGDAILPSPLTAHNGSFESWQVTYNMGHSDADVIIGNDGAEIPIDGAGIPIEFTIDFDAINGNSGEQVTHEDIDVGVTYDETPPVIDELILTSNNANGPKLAKDNDLLTLELVANEFLQQPTFSIAGETDITETAGATEASWSGTYTMQDDDTEGDQVIQITFMDYAGNACESDDCGATPTPTSDGIAVRFDRTLPTLDLVTIESPNTGTLGQLLQVATIGDILTFNIEASEDLKSAPVFTIYPDAAAGGTDITMTQGTSAANWSGAYPMQLGDLEGVVPFSISFEDLVGNLTDPPVTETTNNSNITFDKTPTDISNVVIDLVDASDTGTCGIDCVNDNLTSDQNPEFQITGLAHGGPDSDTYAVGDLIFIYVNDVKTDLEDGTEGGVGISDALNLVLSTLAHQELAYEIKVRSQDKAGNLSEPSSNLINNLDPTKKEGIRIDTQVPATPGTPNLVEGFDSGFSNSDDITNVQKPSFFIYDGTTDNDEIRIYYNVDVDVDDVLVGSFRDLNGEQFGTYVLQNSLSGNTYTFSAIAEDSAGNVSAEGPGLEVTIDITGSDQASRPDLIDSYDSGSDATDNITNISTIAFNVTGLTDGDKIYIKNSGGDVQAEELIVGTSANPIVYAATTSTYIAYTEDIAGNLSLDSDGLEVTIDQAAPDVSAVRSYLTTTSDLGALDNDNLTNDDTPDIEVQDLIINDSVLLYVDGVFDKSLKALYTTMIFTAGSMTDNIHAISIKIRDIAGNLSDFAPLTKDADGEDAVHEIRIDTQAPIAFRKPDLVAEDDNGRSSTDDTTNIALPEFEILDLGIDSVSVRLFYDIGTGYVLSNEVNMAGEADTIQVGSALDGNNYLMTYVIEDSAGNVSDTSDTLSIVLDVLRPSVPNAPDLIDASDLGQSTTDNLTNLATPQFTVTGVDTGAFSSLKYYIPVPEPLPGDTVLITNGTEAVLLGTVTFTAPPLATGNYVFFPVTEDTAGNEREGADLPVSIDLVIPTAAITYAGDDALVRFEDEEILATFQFSEPMDAVTSLPTVNVDYPETLNDLTDQTLTNGGVIDGNSISDGTVWSYAIPLNTSGLDTIDGVIALTLTALDPAGNVVPVEDITGLDGLTVDNTKAEFSSFDVDTDTSINVLDKFGWTLSETIIGGQVLFEKKSGPGSDVTVVLEGLELEEGEIDTSAFISGNPALIDGTFYDIIYTSNDAAGNIGLDTVANVGYDLTGPSVTVTYSQLFVTGDSTVTITATFNEPVLPTPTISLDFGGQDFNFNDTTLSMTISSENDASIWTKDIVAPTLSGNEGVVGISITAVDIATNPHDTADIVIPDDLYVDNTDTRAVFSYKNISKMSCNDNQSTTEGDCESAGGIWQPDTGNVGIGGDVINIIVELNETIVVFDPIPALNYKYASGTTLGDSVDGVIAQSYENDLLVFQITLLDSQYNDGPLEIALVAKDRSNNYVTEFVNATLFQVDNYHPAPFDVDSSTVFGNNAVQGWITGETESVGVVIPIETYAEDSTLFLGGYTDIQFKNLTRGVNWVTIGIQDSITQAGNEMFYRTIAEIEAAMPPNSDLITGDSLAIRASITDRNGNRTYGNEADSLIVYDPDAPVVGQIIGGNMFNDTPEYPDTLFSNDTLSIQWSEFVDEGDDASGFDYYQLAFKKVIEDDTLDFYDWTHKDSITTLPTEPLEIELFLEHNVKYIGHIRGFDKAGNISDILATDVLVRYNTKPTIATLIDAALDEDISWTDTLALTDPDLFVMQGDSFTYKAITTRLVGNAATDSVTIDTSGVLTWTPTQNDTGTYEIQVIATDVYAFADTFKLPLVVTAVNDTPVVDILSPDNNLIWTEDTTTSVEGENKYIKKINLTSYLEDIDNNDSTEIEWQAIILDTTQLDEDFPLGRVIVGPGTPWSVHSRLLREYLGFDLNPKGMKSPVISRSTANQINTRNNMSNPLLSVTINTISSGESWAYFNSDSNYYGSDHRIIIIAQDSDGAEDRDTIMVTVLPKNDAPIISEIPLTEVTENDSIYLKFGSFTTDVDDTDLTFTISATTNEDKISISPSTFLSNDIGDSVLFLPAKLWSQEATIKVIVTDNEEASDTATFILDILRVPRPEIKVAVVQNNAFSNYLQVIVSDTVSKTKFISLEVQNEDIDLDTIAAFTWAGDFNFSTAGNYSIDVLAIADVGDTVVTELIALAAAREASRWFGRSVDGRFSVAGDPGSVSYDQSFIIVDSSLFADDFNDQASYVLGDEFFEFGKPIEVRFGSQRNDLAIYRRKNGVTWEELPSISKDGEIFTFSEKTGYFKLGPKTIIVPEETNIHQNYPNPFNPLTTIMYDIGLMDGLSQNVSITIYNLIGQHVKTLIHDKDQVGQFTVQWNGQNEFGQSMSTGVYFIQLTTQTGIVKNKKMMLLK